MDPSLNTTWCKLFLCFGVLAFLGAWGHLIEPFINESGEGDAGEQENYSEVQS